jgi:hypothetical protein
LEIGRISLATFLHLKTNELPEDRALSLTAILADAINLGLATLIPKIVVQTLQRFSPGWLSPDLEAGVSESPSGQKFGEQIHKQLQPSQRGRQAKSWE